MTQQEAIEKISANLKEIQKTETTGNGGEKYTTTYGAVVIAHTNGNIQYQGKTQAQDRARQEIENAHSPIITSQTNGKQIFIVYGHNKTAREQLELALHKMRLDHSKVVNDNGQTIIEALEGKLPSVSCGIVLMTKDDRAMSDGDYQNYKAQGKDIDGICLFRPRQNVVLELGMLLARLGREQVIIIKQTGVDNPSDLNGVFYVEFKNDVKEALDLVADRLLKIGFAIEAKDLLEAKK